MSKFLSERHKSLVPYTPGEQPRGGFIKLNTNESPFPPPPCVIDALAGKANNLHLYSDPTGAELRAALAEYHDVSAESISLGNGSDESLAFAFLAFGDEERPFVFPDVTYGLYPVISNLFGIPYEELPLMEDYSIGTEEYAGIEKNIVLANPNAPTGLALPLHEIEFIAATNPENVVIIDEAYADFWGQSAIPLTREFDNLLVVRTYSKSRFMAGARLGYIVGSKELIADIEAIRYSFNPYNINTLTLAAGAAALRENDYFVSRWAEINETRDETKKELHARGFEVTDSAANFLFARHERIDGAELYMKLRERGILVRSLGHPRIRDRIRITVGSREQMAALITALDEIFGGGK